MGCCQSREQPCPVADAAEVHGHSGAGGTRHHEQYSSKSSASLENISGTKAKQSTASANVEEDAELCTDVVEVLDVNLRSRPLEAAEICGLQHNLLLYGVPAAGNEAERIMAMKAMQWMTQAPAPELDILCKVAADLYDAPHASITLFDGASAWVSNITNGEAHRNSNILAACPWIFLHPHPIILPVEDLLKDARFCESVWPKRGVRAYLSAPMVTSGGHRMGTICWVDIKPRKIDACMARVMNNLAELAVREMERYLNITARLKVEEELASSYSLRGMSRALEAVTEACVLLVDGSVPGLKLLYAGPTWEDWTGCKREAVVGSLLSDILDLSAANACLSSHGNFGLGAGNGANLDWHSTAVMSTVGSSTSSKGNAANDGQVVSNMPQPKAESAPGDLARDGAGESEQAHATGGKGSATSMQDPGVSAAEQAYWKTVGKDVMAGRRFILSGVSVRPALGLHDLLVSSASVGSAAPTFDMSFRPAALAPLDQDTLELCLPPWLDHRQYPTSPTAQFPEPALNMRVYRLYAVRLHRSRHYPSSPSVAAANSVADSNSLMSSVSGRQAPSLTHLMTITPASRDNSRALPTPAAPGQQQQQPPALTTSSGPNIGWSPEGSRPASVLAGSSPSRLSAEVGSGGSHQATPGFDSRGSHLRAMSWLGGRSSACSASTNNSGQGVPLPSWGKTQSLLTSVEASADGIFAGLTVSHMLGRGGYGVVMQGVWHDTQVAIKVQDHKFGNIEERAAAELEIAIGHQLAHPNVMRTLAFASALLVEPVKRSLMRSATDRSCSKLSRPLNQLPAQLPAKAENASDLRISLLARPAPLSVPPTSLTAAAGQGKPATQLGSCLSSVVHPVEPAREQRNNSFMANKLGFPKAADFLAAEGMAEPEPEGDASYDSMDGEDLLWALMQSPEPSGTTVPLKGPGAGEARGPVAHSAASVPCPAAVHGLAAPSLSATHMSHTLLEALQRTTPDKTQAVKAPAPQDPQQPTAAPQPTHLPPCTSVPEDAAYDTQSHSNAAHPATSAPLEPGTAPSTAPSTGPSTAPSAAPSPESVYPQRVRTWTVMEFADGGTLQDAVDRGWFRSYMSQAAPPDLALLLDVGLDIARGLEHLHAHSIVHGDLSGFNVMLCSQPDDQHSTASIVARAAEADKKLGGQYKASQKKGAKASGPPSGLQRAQWHAAAYGQPSQALITGTGTGLGRGCCPTRFVAKVMDFGKAHRLPSPSDVVQAKSYATITHMAPETLQAFLLSTAADMYAFGVLMWGLFTGSRPWAGLSHGRIVSAVSMERKTLTFPDMNTAAPATPTQPIGTAVVSSTAAHSENVAAVAKADAEAHEAKRKSQGVHPSMQGPTPPPPCVHHHPWCSDVASQWQALALECMAYDPASRPSVTQCIDRLLRMKVAITQFQAGAATSSFATT